MASLKYYNAIYLVFGIRPRDVQYGKGASEAQGPPARQRLATPTAVLLGDRSHLLPLCHKPGAAQPLVLL